MQPYVGAARLGGVQLFAAPVQPRDTDERYTPPAVFDALGVTFDLDVAAPPGGVRWIPAARHYTAADDGLAQPWAGSVWCNPPFSNAGPWADRFADHDAGVILFPLNGNASWLVRLLGRVDPILLLEHVRFHHPTHTGRHVPVMVALGARGDAYTAALHRAAGLLPGALLYRCGP